MLQKMVLTNCLKNMSVSYAITEQNDRLFTGNVTYMENGKEMVEGFAGAIGLDNKTLYVAEFNEGYTFGTIISDDVIDLIYLERWERLAAIDKLYPTTNVTMNMTNATRIKYINIPKSLV